MNVLFKVFTLVLFLGSASSWAGSKKEFGVIDHYRLGDNKIVISDQTFTFAKDFKAYKTNGSALQKTSLTKGSKVLYVSDWVNKELIVVRIDLLPSSAKAEHYDSDEE